MSIIDTTCAVVECSRSNKVGGPAFARGRQEHRKPLSKLGQMSDSEAFWPARSVRTRSSGAAPDAAVWRRLAGGLSRGAALRVG